MIQESQPSEDTPLGNNARQRRIPVLVMWYLPVTNHLRRIFLNPKEDALMTWWDNERKVDDDTIAHPTDCSQWQRFDEKHKEFSDDPREDGMLGLLGWYYVGVLRCIQEDSLPKKSMLLKDKLQVPQQIILYIL